MQRTRSGVVIIVVAGICAVLATLTLALIVKMRAEAAESAIAARYTQARLMLNAGLCYILEAGRVGWESDTYDPSTGAPTTAGGARHEEAFGWVDVRDGFMGPKPAAYTVAQVRHLTGPGSPVAALIASAQGEAAAKKGCPLEAWEAQDVALRTAQRTVPSPNFPCGTAGRFPMGVRKRAPFAQSLNVIPNPIRTWVTDPYLRTGSDGKPDTAAWLSDRTLTYQEPFFGVPLLLKPDPQPAVMDPATFAVDLGAHRRGEVLLGPGGTPLTDAAGNAIPAFRQNSLGLSWFRIYRDGPDTFIITCGAGSTQGFRDWAEVDAASRSQYFADDARIFSEALSREVRLWYRVQWSPAITNVEPCHVSWNNGMDGYGFYNHNWVPGWDRAMNLTSANNVCGSIQWIQRLPRPPRYW